MTIPAERTRAVLYAQEFLRDLLDPQKTPRVPRVIRDRARRVLRHYPGKVDLWEAGRKAPGTFDASEIRFKEDA